MIPASTLDAMQRRCTADNRSPSETLHVALETFLEPAPESQRDGPATAGARLVFELVYAGYEKPFCECLDTLESVFALLEGNPLYATECAAIGQIMAGFFMLESAPALDRGRTDKLCEQFAREGLADAEKRRGENHCGITFDGEKVAQLMAFADRHRDLAAKIEAA